MRAKISISMLALLVALAAATPAVAVEKSVLQQLQQKVLRDYEKERERERVERAAFGGKSEAEYFARIPAGIFRMGDIQSAGRDSEKPVHRVSIKAFLLGKTEVTFAQWDACVAAGGCSHKPGARFWGRGNRPVINVSWKDIAEQYIPWLNKTTGNRYRLPTEAEWEYAARAGSETKYSWGNSIGTNKANCDGCGSRWDDSKTAPVASFAANAFGLYDMHGNVWEWTQDSWNGSYKGAPSDGTAWLSGKCGRRVLRGGSWYSVSDNLRSAFRGWNTCGFRSNNVVYRGLNSSGSRSNDIGFRIARTLD